MKFALTFLVLCFKSVADFGEPTLIRLYGVFTPISLFILFALNISSFPAL